MGDDVLRCLPGRAEVRDRAAEVLEIIGLTDRAGDLVKAYSGGMKRRLRSGQLGRKILAPPFL